MTEGVIMEADTSENTSFSKALPGMQIALDSTSLTEFKICPRRYYYGIICGWEPKATSFHLIFGILYHGALERYDHKRCEGLSHDESTEYAVDWLLRNTWNKELARPWVSGDPNKNRLTLIRTVIDYLDKFGANDVLRTITLANGKPAVELSFSFFSGKHTNYTAEAIVFCGHLDRLAEMNGNVYWADRKTTSHTIGKSWFDQWTPNNQFSLYSLASKVIWKQPVAGGIVDGAQIAVGFSRFERGIVNRSEGQLKEWHRDSLIAMESMEACAVQKYWPMNDSACGMYGGCKFRSVCSKSPESRAAWMHVEFQKRTWDPLQRRGDI